MLTENPDVAQSAFGSHRVITDRWKGMNHQQIDQIRQTQVTFWGNRYEELTHINIISSDS